LLLGGLAALVFAVYAACLRFPFIQDDWALIARFRAWPPRDVIAAFFGLKGSLFFRPLSGLYLYSMYGVFGANPIPFHVAALLVLIVDSWLVAAIMKRLTGDELLSYAIGLVYAMGAAVHLECLLWAVGILDLGGCFFFLLAMLLFLKRRALGSAVAFLAGCLFKEAVLVLPFVLAAYVLIVSPGGAAASRVKALRRLLPMSIVLCVAVAARLLSLSLFSLPQSHPYAARLLGGHILHNAYSYPAWMVQCFDPFLLSRGAAMGHVLNDLVLVLLFCFWLLSRARRSGGIAPAGDPSRPAGEPAQGRPSREPDAPGAAGAASTLEFFLVWIVVALLPIVFFANHTYRYYAVYSLPAFAGAVFMILSIVTRSAGLGPRARRALVLIVAASAAILSGIQTQRVLREGLVQVTLADGTNYLVRRAAMVEMVREGLVKLLPAPPRGATILIGGVEMGAFHRSSGPRVWYGDPTLNVYSLDDFAYDGSMMTGPAPPEDEIRVSPGEPARWIRLNPAAVFAFRLEETGLRRVDLTGQAEAPPPRR